MHVEAKTPKEYIDRLPPERREALAKVRRLIRKHLPEGYEETMQYGMIGYVVPLTLYPAGYLGKKAVPLPYIALSSQKNYMSLYLMSVYGNLEAEKWFAREYKASGKKLDMGKSCVRFRTLDDLPLPLIAAAVARTPVSEYVTMYERAQKRRRPR